jgi:hypothetical protein
MIVEMLGDMKSLVRWRYQTTSSLALMTWGCDGPKWIWRLRPPESSRQATMMVASDSLPTRNEEYGTRVYWRALTHRFCLFLSLFFECLVTRGYCMHSESFSAYSFLPEAQVPWTSLRVTKMSHTSFAQLFLTRWHASPFSAMTTRRSRKMCVFLL